MGYSAYDEEGLKRAAARRSSEADAVTLPYCEGLEVRRRGRGWERLASATHYEVACSAC